MESLHGDNNNVGWRCLYGKGIKIVIFRKLERYWFDLYIFFPMLEW